MGIIQRARDCVFRPSGLGCALVHDLGHSVTAGILAFFAHVAFHSWPWALILACFVWPLIQEWTDYLGGPRKVGRDSVHDLATYQLPLVVYFALTGGYIAAAAVLLLMAVDVVLYYWGKIGA